VRDALVRYSEVMTDARDDPRTPYPDRSADDAMTRSEEVLEVGTVWRPAERVRFRRSIVEEDVTVTVRVRREELHIEREPVSRYEEPVEGGGLGPDGELTILLREERPVVGVEVVPREQVRIVRVLEHVEDVEIRDEVRKERIEVEGDVTR
jgi:stress response protein YsnF